MYKYEYIGKFSINIAVEAMSLILLAEKCVKEVVHIMVIRFTSYMPRSTLFD